MNVLTLSIRPKRVEGIEPTWNCLEGSRLTSWLHPHRAADRHRTGNHRRTRSVLFSLSFSGIMDLVGSAPTASCVQNRRSPE